MSRGEIIVLLITIFLSTGLLSLFLNNIFKEKVTKSQKTAKVDKTTVTEEKKEVKEPVQDKIEQKELLDSETEVKEASNVVPEVSQGLKDELEEFRAYLKERITPENVNANNEKKHPYTPPKLNHFADDDFSFDNAFNDDFDLNYTPRANSMRSRSENVETEITNLSNDIKILLISNFFNPKFW